jgi:hypothetical protein
MGAQPPPPLPNRHPAIRGPGGGCKSKALQFNPNLQKEFYTTKDTKYVNIDPAVYSNSKYEKYIAVEKIFFFALD